MTLEHLKSELNKHPSYFKKGKKWLALKFNVNLELVEQALKELKSQSSDYRKSTPSGSRSKQKFTSFVEKIKDRNPGLDLIPEDGIEPMKTTKRVPYKKGDPNNVLIIGDLHSPWILEGYLDFNLELQKKYNAGTVVFIGDIIDGHAWNFHTHDVDGMSVRDELNLAIDTLRDWYKAFPEATITLGNHDLLISRKAREYGLSQLFIRHLGDILEAPKTWNFVQNKYIDKVFYTHGSTGNAIKRAKEMRTSVVQGHLHSEAFVDWSVSEIDAIFGLQVGCGIDRHIYAFEYAKEMPKKPIISSGVVLDKGRLPIIELMRLP